MAEGDVPEAVDVPVKIGRRQDGTWEKGVSGNPKGMPTGSRHKATLAVESLLEGQSEGITRKAVELALAGDTVAIRLCLDRTVPVRRDRTIQFDLPRLEKPADAIAAASAITQAVSLGEITPLEAEALSRVVDVFVSALGAHDLAGRIASLEASRDESSES